jgi:hypothetical protein
MPFSTQNICLSLLTNEQDHQPFPLLTLVSIELVWMKLGVGESRNQPHCCHKIDFAHKLIVCASLPLGTLTVGCTRWSSSTHTHSHTHILTPSIVLGSSLSLICRPSHTTRCHLSMSHVACHPPSPVARRSSPVYSPISNIIQNRSLKNPIIYHPPNNHLKSICICSSFSHEDSLLLCYHVLFQARGGTPPGCHVALAYGCSRQAYGRKGRP